MRTIVSSLEEKSTLSGVPPGVNSVTVMMGFVGNGSSGWLPPPPPPPPEAEEAEAKAAAAAFSLVVAGVLFFLSP
jgi:hypothetical protein